MADEKLGQAGQRGQRHRRGRRHLRCPAPDRADVQGSCPFHDDHRPSFDVDPRRQRYRAGPAGNMAMSSPLFKNTNASVFAKRWNCWRAGRESLWKKRRDRQQNRGRAVMLDVVRWAAEQFHQCLLDVAAGRGRPPLPRRARPDRRDGSPLRPRLCPAGGRLAGAAGGQAGLSTGVAGEGGADRPAPEGQRATTTASATGSCFRSATRAVRRWGLAGGFCRHPL